MWRRLLDRLRRTARHYSKGMTQKLGLAATLLLDVTAIDWLGRRVPRFDVVYHFLCPAEMRRIRLKVALEETALEVPTLTGRSRALTIPLVTVAVSPRVRNVTPVAQPPHVLWNAEMLAVDRK